MKIEVTREDINRAGCPIYRALKRTFNTEDVAAGYRGIRVDRQIADTPKSAFEFMLNWDTDRIQPKPFCFELEFNTYEFNLPHTD